MALFGVEHATKGDAIWLHIRQHQPSHVVMETSIGELHGTEWMRKLSISTAADDDVQNGGFWAQESL